MKGIEIFQICVAIFIAFIGIYTVYKINNTNLGKFPK